MQNFKRLVADGDGIAFIQPMVRRHILGGDPVAATLRLQIVERWSGRSPLVVPADPNNTGAALLLPLGPPEKSPVP